jgi:hypothetical protein
MPALNERDTLGNLLKYEAPQLYSRDIGTLAAGQNLNLGTVLAKRTSDGKWLALDPAASDGSEIALGVLAIDCDATLIDRDDALVIARHAIVARTALRWPAAITLAQKATAQAQLEARGILVRDAA